MRLSELLPKYPCWIPGHRRPIFITTAGLLQQVTGFTRQYCYEFWRGGAPVTKPLAKRLHQASRKLIPLEKLFACDPQEWPARQREALAARRAQEKLRLAQLTSQLQNGAGPSPTRGDVCDSTSAENTGPGGSNSGTR